jgi:hypothetical protein
MKRFLIALLVCFSGMAGAQELNIARMPLAVLTAKNVLLVFTPIPAERTTSSSLLKSQQKTEELFAKWNRFQIVNDPHADLVIMVADYYGSRVSLDVFGPDGPRGEKLWTEEARDLPHALKDFRKSIELAERH